MRRIRIAICFLFVAACVIFGMYIVKVKMVEDHEPPVITCEEDSISVSVEAGDDELLAGVKAKDNRDGDLTKAIRVSSMSHFIEKGKRNITYVVFDRANQSATAQRTLVYTDYRSPRIYLKKPPRYMLKDLNSAEFMKNVTVEDCLDGDLTKQIYTTWEKGTYPYEPGKYVLTYEVSNSAGDVRTVPIEITVMDSGDSVEAGKNYPVLSDYIAYTSVGKEMNPASYLTGITSGGTEYFFAQDMGNLSVSKSDVEIQSKVNYSVPGVYPIEYTYVNKEGIRAVTTLTVVVEE